MKYRIVKFKRRYYIQCYNSFKDTWNYIDTDGLPVREDLAYSFDFFYTERSAKKVIKRLTDRNNFLSGKVRVTYEVD